jgi:RNA polymerase sigma-70 factor (ECF subfamily)
VVLETLAPAERLAFVLHNLFAVPFDEIAPIVGRTPVAARQLASRARRRVQGAGADEAVTQDRPSNLLDADRTRQREIVDAFLAASRGGDFEALLAMLAPDVVLRADHTAVLASAARESQGAPKLAPEARGAAAVVEIFGGRARAAQPAVINGAPGLAWAPGGQPRVVFAFTITSGKIVEINMVADPVHLGRLDLALLEG